jgi:hypothetical protein
MGFDLSRRVAFAARCTLVGACLAIGIAGCERKERVLDVQTPEGSLEVDRNVDTGEVEVNVTDKD